MTLAELLASNPGLESLRSLALVMDADTAARLEAIPCDDRCTFRPATLTDGRRFSTADVVAEPMYATWLALVSDDDARAVDVITLDSVTDLVPKPTI